MSREASVEQPWSVTACARRAARELSVLLVFCLFTAGLTWPYATRLYDAVVDPGDPYLVTWIMWWDYHQTFRDPLHLFQANTFYPLQYTLAFSEHCYGLALPFFPLFALGLRPLTVHAVAIFLGFALSGYGAFRLARTLTGSEGAAWVAGVAFAFVPFRFTLMSQLVYLFSPWLPLLFEALVLFARRRTGRRAAWFGFAFFMTGLTSVSFFALALVPLALCGAWLLTRYGLWRDGSFWRRGAAALCLAALGLVPFMLPYYFVSKLYGFSRSIEEVKRYSAWPLDWLAVESRNKLWSWLNVSPGEARFRLFPGLLTLLFASAALLPAGLLRGREGTTAGVRKPGSPRGGEAFWLGAILTLVGFGYSLGWNFFFYRLCYYLLPVFRSMRVPARGAMFAYLGLALLAGLGVRRLAEALSARRPRVSARAVYVVACVLLLFELNAAPLDFIRGEAEPDAVTLKLRETEMRGGVVILPAGADFNHRYMLRAADHARPLVVGTSGFNSPQEDRIEREIASGPLSLRLLDLFEEIPASYLVVKNEFIPPERRKHYEAFLAYAVATGRLRFVQRFEGRDDLYAVVRTEPDARTEGPPPADLELRDWASLIDEDPLKLLGQDGDWSGALYRLHLVVHGRMPRREEFMPEARAVGRGLFPGTEEQQHVFDAHLAALAREWEARAEPRELFGLPGDARFVEQLYRNAGVEPDPAERAALVAALASGAETRASALLKVAADPRLERRERYRGPLLVHYFAYLRRNPDDPPDRDLSGFNFWLDNISRTKDYKSLGHAFMESEEYRGRQK